MAKGKACGPDGFPTEFFQQYWPIIKHDLIDVLHDLYDNKVDLWCLNKSHISLIPKKPGSNRLEDFRSISVLSFIPKLNTKILADRLSTLLPSLIAKNQTAFVQNRRIVKKILIAREKLSFLHRNKIPSVLLKIDFRKAFDTISWEYFEGMLRARQFPNRWNSWIHNLLISSSSVVRTNGNNGTGFFHRKGLRQGDPLSLMLFILAAETLQTLISNIQNDLLQTPRCKTEILQFADDTIIFTSAHSTNLTAIMGVLRNFVRLSGLHLNHNTLRR
jgi:Reverse transcriptase (RNA-dependent DNA polymerase)